MNRLNMIGRILEMMDQWPDDARPDHLESPKGEESTAQVISFAVAIGWIKDEIIQAHCHLCGGPKHGSTFFRITPAGQAALDLSRYFAREIDRRYPGKPGDDDEFENAILASAVELLREDASHHNTLTTDALYETEAEHHEQERDKRLKLASYLEMINRERTATSLSVKDAPQLAEAEAKFGEIGLHHGFPNNIEQRFKWDFKSWSESEAIRIVEVESVRKLANGINALFGKELEQYLIDRMSQAIDDDDARASVIASSFADDGWIVRRSVIRS